MSTATEQTPEWTLGWRLQRSLAHANMTVEAMAEELDVSRSTVSRWINEKGGMKTIYKRQWALRCGVPVAWLSSGAFRPTGDDYPRSNSAPFFVPAGDNGTLVPAA